MKNVVGNLEYDVLVFEFLWNQACLRGDGGSFQHVLWRVGSYVVQAGLVLCQCCVPENRRAIWTQNSHLKQCISGGRVRELTASPCIVYDYTTSEHTDL